jgi:hypothetical protein
MKKEKPLDYISMTLYPVLQPKVLCSAEGDKLYHDKKENWICTTKKCSNLNTNIGLIRQCNFKRSYKTTTEKTVHLYFLCCPWSFAAKHFWHTQQPF